MYVKLGYAKIGALHASLDGGNYRDKRRCDSTADGHPGNILIGRGGRVGLLDYGQSKQLPDEHRRAFAELVLALNKGRPTEVSAALGGLGVVTERDDPLVDPFDPNSPIKRSAISTFPQDMFFVLRVVQLLRESVTDYVPPARPYAQPFRETLLEHLKALQSASATWQRSMVFASKSHQELMEQVESTTEELRSTYERLRAVEAQRLAAVHDAETLRTRVTQHEAHIQELQGALKIREDELATAQFTVHEVVAKLTADNLVFLMQLKKAEADLAAANQERSQLRLAAERQRGPWFDQVRAGVEERVRQALQRSEELEAQLQRREVEHARQLQDMETVRQQLEEELAAVRVSAEDLQLQLSSAVDAQCGAESRSASADAAVAELRHRVEELAAENRVLQESVKSMRQECTERWVSEQAAQGRVGGLEEHIQELKQALERQEARTTSLQQQLDVQAGVNRQLMARKAEVEWQLMAAMAKHHGQPASQ
ncbi:hypothetical protein GPECTOR_14g55 [Gonium pectorale]|uniref:ABC1 atypical kinase-like domain-containing protein n=1 Tax=Gonium pectorale TaxID=33097 RepID=A0A150GP22_GONPE|nr:hypothetical protein GPECTOR_14g55 [Gonium pectorale]|eukprot:KXZ51070.1 hypothetical protein GPECTOR_14g55 [Gonium pectorale]